MIPGIPAVWLVPSVFLVLGTYILLKYVVGAFRADASENWPSTPGTIKTTEIKYIHNDPNYWSVTINYQYLVAGCVFNSDVYSFGDHLHFYDEVDAKEFIAKFPISSQVTIYYNPRNPSISTMQKGELSYSKIALVLGTISFFIGIFQLIKNIFF